MSVASQLPHISEARPLQNSDHKLIEEITEVLKKHDALSRFGLVLLHQHFPINHETEVLVESTDEEGRVQMTRPVPKKELSSLEYTETSWRFDTGEPLMACVCVKGPWGHSHYGRG